MYTKTKLTQSKQLALVCALASLGAVTAPTSASESSSDLRDFQSACANSTYDENLKLVDA